MKQSKREGQYSNNRFLWSLDVLREKLSRTQYMDPKKILTANRQDTNYRINFLEDVYDKNLPFNKTFYYHFISDPDKGTRRNSELSSKQFCELFEDIKKNGIIKPVTVGKFSSDFITTRYIMNGEKFWKKYENKTGYQLLNGSHRLAIGLYLKWDKIPVKVLKPYSFEIPDYSSYIGLKKNEYLAKIG